MKHDENKVGGGQKVLTHAFVLLFALFKNEVVQRGLAIMTELLCLSFSINMLILLMEDRLQPHRISLCTIEHLWSPVS